MDDRPLDKDRSFGTRGGASGADPEPAAIGFGNGRCLAGERDPSWPEVAGPVKRFLRRVVGADRAEDLASETMLVLLESTMRGRVRRPLSFALRVAWNKAVDLLRRRHPADDAGSEGLDGAFAPDPRRIAELREWLDSGLRRLGPEDRALLHLRYELSLGYREIGATLDVPVGTVGRRLHEARRRLAAVLGKSDERRGLAFLSPAWWVLDMSKRVVAAAVVLLVGTAGLSWWLIQSEDHATAPAAASAAPDAVAAPDARAAAAAAPAAPAPKIEPKAAPPEDAASTGVVPAVLRGRVVDEAGRPVGGARVHIASRAASAGFDIDADPDVAAPRRAVRSAADGRFAADVGGLGAAFDLAAAAEGYAVAILEDISLSGPEVEIRLGAGLRILGTVRDLQEQPIAGAKVTFRGLAGKGRLSRAATSDTQGNFELGPIPDPSNLTLGMAQRGGGTTAMGEAHLFVEAEGYAPQRTGISTSSSANGGTESVDIHLARGGVVEGIVTAADGGAPIAGAEVVVWTMEGIVGSQVRQGIVHRNPFGSRVVARGKTGEDGRYRIEHVPAPVGGIRMLSTNAMFLGPGRRLLGGVAAWRDGFTAAGQQLGVPNADGEIQTVDLALRNAAIVTGRVVDQSGSPIAGVRVFCLEDLRNSHGAGIAVGGLVPGEAGAFGGSAVTDADGRFRHASVPALGSRALAVWCFACGCDLGLPASQKRMIEVAAGNEVALADFVIERKATFPIEGEVRDPRGAPVAGARLDWGRMPGFQGSNSNTPLPVWTDREGRFRMLVSPPGSDEAVSGPLASRLPRIDRAVVVSARGFVRQVVDPPAAGVPLVVVLQPAAILRGVAVRSDGAPVGGAEILAIPPAFAGANAQVIGALVPIAVARADASGLFALDVPEGPVVVAAFKWGEGMAMGTAGPVSASDAGIRVVVPWIQRPETVPLSVRVVDATTGKPWIALLTGEAVRSEAEGIAKLSGRGEAETAGPGLLRFTTLSPGSYDLTIRSPGWAPATLKGVVLDTKAAPRVLDLRLGGEAGIDGSVAPPGADVPVDAVLVVATDAARREIRVETGADGKFRMRGLSPGPWELTASRFRGPSGVLTEKPVPVDVVAGGPSTVQLVLVPAVSTKVVVTCVRRGGAGEAAASRPGNGLSIVLEDAAGRVVGRGIEMGGPDVVTCDLLSPPGPVKAVVRSSRLLGSADGVAGGEIRLSVTID